MFNELNRTGNDMRMKEMRDYALQSNIATKSRKNRKKTESEKTSNRMPFLRSKKAS